MMMYFGLTNKLMELVILNEGMFLDSEAKVVWHQQIYHSKYTVWVKYHAGDCYFYINIYFVFSNIFYKNRLTTNGGSNFCQTMSTKKSERKSVRIKFAYDSTADIF